MKIAVIGGGPSGLYLSLLVKTRFPDARIEVYEQNPRGATYGFGIVLADRGLTRLEKAHPASCEAIMRASYATRHQIISHRGEAIFVERKGYGGAIARLRLLEILEDRCRAAGIPVEHNARIDSLDRFAGYDLIVGADGVNSVVRDAHEAAYGVSCWHLTNRMAWYGTTRHFPYPILAFKTTQHGRFWCAAYPYTERMSTFVAECDDGAWQGSGLASMSPEEQQTYAENVFAEELQGHRLIANKSEWRCLPVIRVRRWFVGNTVLIGDALHSAHPSIGSGTRIAMEDAIDLADALHETQGDIAAALASFERTRKTGKQKMVDAVEKSFNWYEDIGETMEALSPAEFVFDFMTRTGRISEARLMDEFPRFMQRYAAQWTAFKQSDHGAKLLRERGLSVAA